MESALNHWVDNVVSFWLHYSSGCIKDTQTIVHFSDCGEDLVRQELRRDIYSGLSGPKELFDEIYKEAHRQIHHQFDMGHYTDVRDFLVDKQAQAEINHTKIVAAFRKQQ